MSDEPSASSTVDIGTLVDELRARVEQRQREGYYPSDLARELHEHFLRISHQRSVPDLDVLRLQLDELDAAGSFTQARIPLDSALPGGQKLHALVAKAVARQTQGVLQQMQQFSDVLRSAMRTMLAALEEPHAHVHADLVGQLDSLFERIAAFERGPIDDGSAAASLRARVEVLESAEASRRFSPFFGNEQFEEHFRGTREEMVDRYRDLAAELDGYSPVLDIGCGRGEFLEALSALGIDASGVEIDGTLVDACRERGYSVEHADGLEFLASRDDGSLGGLVLIQVIEHLTRQQAVELVALAAEKVRPNGRVVIETVNPQSLYVFAHSFYVDPTHTQPVHPAYLKFLFEQAGFRESRIEWRSVPPADDVLQDVVLEGPAGEVLSENIARLNRLLFAPQDYAIIVTR